MPKTIVEGPDGRKFAFPDTMPRSEVNAFMREKYGTKAREETMQDYLARVVRQDRATEARAKDVDREATAVGRAEGERAAARMGVSNPLEMAVAGPAIGLAQQAAGREVFNREGTVLADEAAGLSAANAAAFFVPGMVNRQFGAQLEEGRRQQPAASFAGDLAGGVGPGEIIGAGVMKAAQAIGPGMAAVGRMFRNGPGPDTTNAIVGGTLGGIAPAETAEERARNVAIGAGLGAVARSGSKMAADLTGAGAPGGVPAGTVSAGAGGKTPKPDSPEAIKAEVRKLATQKAPEPTRFEKLVEENRVPVVNPASTVPDTAQASANKAERMMQRGTPPMDIYDETSIVFVPYNGKNIAVYSDLQGPEEVIRTFYSWLAKPKETWPEFVTTIVNQAPGKRKMLLGPENAAAVPPGAVPAPLPPMPPERFPVGAVALGAGAGALTGIPAGVLIGTGLTRERELGSKMKRDKKD